MKETISFQVAFGQGIYQSNREQMDTPAYHFMLGKMKGSLHLIGSRFRAHLLCWHSRGPHFCSQRIQVFCIELVFQILDENIDFFF